MQLTPRPSETKETDALVEVTSGTAEPWRADVVVGHVAGNHLDFPELIGILRRRWRWIAGALALALAFGVLMTALQRREYAATTEIVIYQQAPQKNDDGLATVNKIEEMATNSSIRTQIRLLRSGDLVAQALSALPEHVRKTGLRNGPQIQIKEPAEGDNVITLTVKALTPQAAAGLANNLAQELIKHDVEESRQTSATALTYVSSELNNVHNDLQTARRQLAEFEVEYGVAGDDEVLNQHVKSLSELQLEADQASRTATTSRQLAQSIRDRMSGARRGILSDVTAAQNPLVDKADMQIDDLEARRLQLRQEFAPDAPEIKEVEGELRAALTHRAQLLATEVSPASRPQSSNSASQVLGQQYFTAMNDADAAQIRLGVLQHEIAAKRVILSKLPSLETRASELKNNVNLLEATSALLSKNFQSLRVNEASQISNVRVLNRAYENPIPVSPNTRRNLVLSLVFGILLAVIVTVALEATDNRIYSQHTLEGITQHPTLAQISTVSGGAGPLLLDTQYQTNPAWEQMQLLRSSLVLMSPGATHRIIAVTSPGVGDGKSTTAMNLAVTMALEGERTVLVDANLHRPILHTYLGVSNSAGLTSMITGNADLADTLLSTPVKGLSLLPAGPLPSQLPETVSTSQLRLIITKLAEQYDAVIIDAAPADNLNNMLALAPVINGFLLVVSAGQTETAPLQTAWWKLKQLGTPILGCILNRAKSSGLS